jgi:acetyltransferase-like isoleucine patch superfamily enzyme
MQPEGQPVVHVNRSKYFSRILKTNPFELWRILMIALNTAKYRYLLRCIGKGTVVGVRTEIVNSANVKIGRDCLLQDAVYIRAGTDGKITMGDRAAINSFARLFGHGTIEIGEDAQIGPGCLITTTDHNIYENLEASFKKVTIGRRAWIGANVTVLPGITIGDHAVVGAGSVVTRDVPPYAVVVGVPARVIREIGAPEEEVVQDIKGEMV